MKRLASNCFTWSEKFYSSSLYSSEGHSYWARTATAHSERSCVGACATRRFLTRV